MEDMKAVVRKGREKAMSEGKKETFITVMKPLLC